MGCKNSTPKERADDGCTVSGTVDVANHDAKPVSFVESVEKPPSPETPSTLAASHDDLLDQLISGKTSQEVDKTILLTEVPPTEVTDVATVVQKKVSDVATEVPTVAEKSEFDPEKWVRASPEGVYLKYLSENGGMLVASWSKTYQEGALGFAKASSYVRVPDYKFKKNVTLQSNANMGHNMFFQGWAAFVKEVKSVSGEVVMLAASTDHPPVVIWSLSGELLRKTTMNSQPLNLHYIDTVFITNPSFFKMDGYLSTGISAYKFSELARNASEKVFVVFAK